MIKPYLFKFFAPAVCFFSFVHGVSNADLPEMGHLEDSPLRNDMKIFNPLIYKGVNFINDYGWGITLHSFLKQIKLKGKLYNVKYFPNEKFGFSLIKIDLGNDHQRAVLPQFLRLATPEDLEYYSHWVTSCALVSNLDLTNGKISDDEQPIKSYKKPLSCYSKVERRENGFLCLGEGMNKVYEELWSHVKKTLIDYCLKNYSHVIELTESPDYKIKYLQNKQQALIQKRDLLMKESNTLQSQIYKLIDQKKGPNDFVSIKIIDLHIACQQEQMFSKQKEIAGLLSFDEGKLWEAHMKELELKKDNYINYLYAIHFIKNINNIKLKLNKFYKIS